MVTRVCLFFRFRPSSDLGGRAGFTPVLPLALFVIVVLAPVNLAADVEAKAVLPRIAVFAGPTATILSVDPPLTSRKAREQYGLPPLRDWFGHPVRQDALHFQRLAAPVTVYIEQFSAHPLERDAAELFAPPDGYLDASNAFHPARQAPSDRPVYKVELRPEDGLYPLPYMARRVDGSAWDGFEGAQGGVRQTFYPDASRLFEELERTGSTLNGNLSARADLIFHRAAPSGGYTRGLPEAERTDAGAGDIAPEFLDRDFFPYGYGKGSPPRSTLAVVTNAVQRALADNPYRGVLWLEGSPRVEDTAYWLGLVIDTEAVIVGASAQRPNHRLAADAQQTLVDAVDFIRSDVWRDEHGGNRVGAVVVQDQQILAAREAIKNAARPGGFATLGGHGGVIGTTQGPVLTFLPNRRHGRQSEVRISLWPAAVAGVKRNAGGGFRQVQVETKDEAGRFHSDAVPQVEIVDLGGWMSEQPRPDGSVTVRALVAAADRAHDESRLAGLVAESPQGGHYSTSEAAALDRLALRGLPIVKVFRGTGGGFVHSNPHNLLIEAGNLNAHKARVLLMACLLRFGSPPPAVNADSPTPAEMAAVRAHLARYQAVFDTH